MSTDWWRSGWPVPDAEPVTAPMAAGTVSSAVLKVRTGPAGVPVVEDIRCCGALALRPGPSAVWMVAAAASPIGGDHQHVRITVGEGCRLVVGSVSATVARRGPNRRPSLMLTVARVAAGATLVWEPEPGVAAEGSDHLVDSRVRLVPGASVWWREEWVLGRHGEDPGRWRSRMRLHVGAAPVLVSDTATGPGAPGWESRAVLAGARAFSGVVAVGPAYSSKRAPAAGVVMAEGDAPGTAFALAGTGWQVSAWGEDLDRCRNTVAGLLDRLGISPIERPRR